MLWQQIASRGLQRNMLFVFSHVCTFWTNDSSAPHQQTRARLTENNNNKGKPCYGFQATSLRKIFTLLLMSQKATYEYKVGNKSSFLREVHCKEWLQNMWQKGMDSIKHIIFWCVSNVHLEYPLYILCLILLWKISNIHPRWKNWAVNSHTHTTYILLLTFYYIYFVTYLFLHHPFFLTKVNCRHQNILQISVHFSPNISACTSLMRV